MDSTTTNGLALRRAQAWKRGYANRRAEAEIRFEDGLRGQPRVERQDYAQSEEAKALRRVLGLGNASGSCCRCGSAKSWAGTEEV